MTDPFNPYTLVHENPQGAGDARPTALQIIHDEDLVNKLTDKLMLVTGASSGIGIETTRALYGTGAMVFMAVRDMKRGQEVKEDILRTGKEKGYEGKLELLEIRLDDLSSVRKAAKEFVERSGGVLNVLVNNAGIRNPPEGKTVDGFETQFGTNHLGHFLLFLLLRPSLLASSTPAFNSRVVNVSSGSHRRSPINFSNPNLRGIYTPKLGYAQSKTANILMANQISNLYSSSGLHGLSIQPGIIVSRAQRYDDPVETEKLVKVLEKQIKSLEQGAATTVWGAVGKVWEGKGRVYLEDMRKGEVARTGNIMDGGYADFAFDEEAERRLWDMSCEMVGELTETECS